MQMFRQIIAQVNSDFKNVQHRKNVENYSKIRNNLNRKIQNHGIFFYGSRIMGVSTSDSDIDVCISMYDSYFYTLERNLAAAKAAALIEVLEEMLLIDRRNWQVERVLKSSRCPLITAFFKPLGIKCDITFSNGLGVENTKMLAHLFTIQPNAARLCLVVKEFLNRRGVGLKNYAVVLLVVFFLQQNNFLPSIESVQSGLKSIEIDGYQVQFDGNRGLQDYYIYLMKNLQNDPELLYEFFKFYSNFDFDEIISPFKGHTLGRGFLNLLNTEWRKPLCIAGPIMHDVNAAGNVRTATLQRFIEICEEF